MSIKTISLEISSKALLRYANKLGICLYTSFSMITDHYIIELVKTFRRMEEQRFQVVPNETVV